MRVARHSPRLLFSQSGRHGSSAAARACTAQLECALRAVAAHARCLRRTLCCRWIRLHIASRCEIPCLCTCDQNSSQEHVIAHRQHWPVGCEEQLRRAVCVLHRFRNQRRRHQTWAQLALITQQFCRTKSKFSQRRIKATTTNSQNKKHKAEEGKKKHAPRRRRAGSACSSSRCQAV